MLRENQYQPQTVTHPGTDLSEKLKEIGMGPKEFAVRTRKPEKTITAILKGDSSITSEMAVQFEKVLKIPAHYWLNRQRQYDECKVRLKEQEYLIQAIEWAKRFPVKMMQKYGWIQDVKEKPAIVQELLNYFSIAHYKAWEDYYLNKELKIQFRISLKHSSNPYALSAWLRRGDIIAQGIEVKEFSQKKFKIALQEIKKLMADYPPDFFKQLQSICANAGVKVVYTPCLPKVPIHGATRWINEYPLIQLTGRYNRNDTFWFTFFHEAGHILLHGKKDVFLENIRYDAFEQTKEDEANQFAIEWTFSEHQEFEMLSQKPFTAKDIIRFAKKFNTHPAIIIGRFQHKKMIPYSVGRDLIQPVILDKFNTC